MIKEDDFVMKDDRRDEPARQTKAPRQSVRRDIWLWLCLYDYEAEDLDPTTCNGTTMGSAIARVLKRNPHLLEKANREKDQFMVRDDCLKWIDGGERQYRWLLSRIEDITAFGLPRGLVHLTGRNHLIAMLDHWNVDIVKKAEKIELLRRDWLRHKARDIDFKWFEEKKEGRQRCKCAWEWLQNNRLPRLSLHAPISNYQELLMFFDQADYGPNEQKAIIEKIRKRWSKKQYDERSVAAGKKQVNVELLSTTIDLLDGLAKKHDLTRPQVLERLITMESGLGMIEKHFTRHASKEIAAVTSSNTSTKPAHTWSEHQDQQSPAISSEPSSALIIDSSNVLTNNCASEPKEAQTIENASPRQEAGPPQSIQVATQCPPSIGERPRTLGDLVREQEEARKSTT